MTWIEITFWTFTAALVLLSILAGDGADEKFSMALTIAFGMVLLGCFGMLVSLAFIDMKETYSRPAHIVSTYVGPQGQAFVYLDFNNQVATYTANTYEEMEAVKAGKVVTLTQSFGFNHFGSNINRSDVTLR